MTKGFGQRKEIREEKAKKIISFHHRIDYIIYISYRIITNGKIRSQFLITAIVFLFGNNFIIPPYNRGSLDIIYAVLHKEGCNEKCNEFILQGGP